MSVQNSCETDLVSLRFALNFFLRNRRILNMILARTMWPVSVRNDLCECNVQHDLYLCVMYSMTSGCVYSMTSVSVYSMTCGELYICLRQEGEWRLPQLQRLQPAHLCGAHQGTVHSEKHKLSKKKKSFLTVYGISI